MKNKWPFISALLALCLVALAVGAGQAQGPGPQGDAGVQTALGTAFTYQGQLQQGGNPVNDRCDFQFSLWSAESDGTQVGTTQAKTNVDVNEGLFTVQLDFGSSAFTGDARWLAVTVRCPTGSGSYTSLSPRQALTAAPYALSLRPGAVVSGGSTTLILSGGNVGLDAGGIFYGVRGWSASPSGWGVYGLSSSSNGRGMVGVAGASSGPTYGVYGQSDSTEGYGVYGYATAASGTTYGVYGESISPGGVGVYGRNTSSGSGVTGASSTGDGVRGQSSGANKSGVYGVNTHSAGFGVYGRNTGVGSVGYLGGSYGVYGESANTDGIGVVGKATAISGATHGVYGESASPEGHGVYGYAIATSGVARGVYGRSDSTSGYGVVGWAAAASGTTYGVYGASTSPNGYGVYGTAPNTYYARAGYFEGNAGVTGFFSVGGSKSFMIDHPMDPANRYLYHFAQEGPEVQNVYNGVVTLDAQGEAVVTLPAYFAALNTGPFRYQLTAIGAPMPNLHIAQEIRDNAFRIAGGVPGKKVSWEVTAIRNDPYLRDHPVQAEVDKLAGERGTYLYPEGYGQPQEMGLDYQRNWDLLERPETEPLPTSGER